MQDARDDGRRGVQEAEVRFQFDEVGGGCGHGGPEEGEVVGEGGEEDAEEEGRRCVGRLVGVRGRGGEGGDGRQRIRKVAKDWVGRGMACGG